MYSPLSPELIPPGENMTLRPYPKTVVAVIVKDLKNGAIHYWSLEKLKYDGLHNLLEPKIDLRQRLEDMRRLSNAEANVSESNVERALVNGSAELNPSIFSSGLEPQRCRCIFCFSLLVVL